MINMEQVSQTVCTVLNTNLEGNTRLSAYARQVTTYLMKKHTKTTSRALARAMGYKTHTVINHNVKKTIAVMSVDKAFHQLVTNIETELLNQK